MSAYFFFFLLLLPPFPPHHSRYCIWFAWNFARVAIRFNFLLFNFFFVGGAAVVDSICFRYACYLIGIKLVKCNNNVTSWQTHTWIHILFSLPFVCKTLVILYSREHFSVLLLLFLKKKVNALSTCVILVRHAFRILNNYFYLQHKM